MSKHDVSGQYTDEIFYADKMMIDSGGIDLFVAGEAVLSASFDKLNAFQLAYEVLPEDYEFNTDQDKTEWQELIAEMSKVDKAVTENDLELLARAVLTALARRNGYEVKETK